MNTNLRNIENFENELIRAELYRTWAPFGWADKPAEKYCWLICCERKILFRLKNKLKKTDYKPGEQAHGRYTKNQYGILTHKTKCITINK
jgi:hypothetical protein